MDNSLINFSKYESNSSKFIAQLGAKGGYVNFSNSGKGGDKKYFTLSLDSFLQILRDINDNISSFQGNENYEEKQWRDLAGKYYTDGPANAMATVQTKPLFSTLSKIVIWANTPQLDSVDPEQRIDLSKKSIEEAINKLSKLSDEYTPESKDINTEHNKEVLIEENTSIRDFAFNTFKHFYGKKWPDLINQTSYRNSSINDNEIITLDFNGFTRLLGEFPSPQTKENLTSGGVLRYFEEPIYENENKFIYFTTQWNGKEDRGRSYNELKTFFEGTYPQYRFEKTDNTFKLFKKGTAEGIDFNYKSFHQKTIEANLSFSEKLITRFTASLCTKPFVICTGLSGSGKTKLAQSFAQWLCNNEEQYKIVPVGADWTNREPLLGYPNALDEKKYVMPDNGVLDLIIHAGKYEHLPHFLILDEMNLSHVERYFADFLSCMESKAAIQLHAEKEGKTGSEENTIPHELKLPANLFIVGTVNIDETTYMFSPKVLDRANVIEFKISDNDIKEYLKNPSRPEMKMLIGKGAEMGPDFINIARKPDFKNQETESINEVLLSFFTELKKCGAEFGYRSASEINRLMGVLSHLDNKLSQNEKIDIAIMQKLLPKLHGSRSKLTRVLSTLAGFCVEAGTDVKKEYLENTGEIDYDDNTKIKFPLSLEKIVRMYKGAIDNGFASYAEA